jgi:integrase
MVEVDQTPDAGEQIIAALGRYAIEEAEDLLTHARATDRPALWTGAFRLIQQAKQILATEAPHTGIKPAPALPKPWDLVANNTTGDSSKPSTLSQAITRFLAAKRDERVRQGTLDNLDLALRQFLDHVGDMSIEAFGSPVLSEYLTWQKARVREGASPRYLGPHVDSVRAFVNWLVDDLELIPKPRILKTRKFNIPGSRDSGEKNPITPAEFQEVLAVSNDRQTLYWLLATNTNMTSIDIAHLKWTEVDFTEGRIIRRRTKTESRNPPVVNFLLWPCTLRLVEQERSNHSELVLVNCAGKCLNRGKYDGIGKVWQCLRKRHSVKKPFMQFRKSSVTLMGAHAEFKSYTQHFLGEKPQDMTARHYEVPSQARFDACCTWLAEQYGVQ